VLPGHLLQQLGTDAFERSAWQEAWSYYLGALKSRAATVDIGHCLLFGGRCALYLGDFTTAQTLLSQFVEFFPEDTEALFYLGRAYQGAHRDLDALNSFNAAAMITPRAKYLAAVGQAAHSLAFEGFGFSEQVQSGTYIAIARAALKSALAHDQNSFEALNESMLLALDTGDLDAALLGLQAIEEREKKLGAQRVRSAVTSFALALTRIGRYDRVVQLEQLSKFQAGRRILARARQFVAPTPPPETQPAPRTALIADEHLGAFSLETLGNGRFGWGKRRETVVAVADTVSIECDVVVPLVAGGRTRVARLVEHLFTLPARFSGIVRFHATARPGFVRPADVAALVLRKTAWNEIIARHPDFTTAQMIAYAIDRLDLFTEARTEPVSVAEFLAPAKGYRPRVLILSRHGPRLVGGGEQFLRIAGTYYQQRGADVFFAGLTKDWSEASTTWDRNAGSTTGFVYEEEGALRDFLVAGAVDAVHVISGLGEFVIDACAGLNVRLLYGVHFWREFIAGTIASRPFYPRVTIDNAKPLPLMRELMTTADFLYVNSDFCADIARKLYASAPPIIYSVPLDAEEAEEPEGPPVSWPQDYILLANARADKGWAILLSVAARLPHRQFLAIANQSDRGAAMADVRRLGLDNVTVIDRTGQMAQVYKAARLVLVPSFSFVETFSRVVIEAGRLSRPVLMADSGNLPYLGKGTDLVLPEDPQAWAERIEQILSKPVQYKHAVKQTKAIADKYTADSLLANLAKIPLPGLTPRVLVCVGSGLGNICHTTPMIRALATAIGAPVDVLVAGDFRGSDATMDGAEAVSQVFETFEHVAHRHYDLVLVTHSFGSTIPSFNASRVLVSRDLDSFEPGGDVHESTFNLRFLEKATGIGAAEEAERAYFFGALGRETVPGREVTRVGLHAGSKGGIWAAKRWPGFARLAGELTRRGVEVISVGTADEYVEGTLDKTGLTISRMAEEIAGLDAVVSNDSGVMNVANALGVPLVALFGPTNPVTRGPISADVRILTPGTGCAPCEASREHEARFNDGKCQCIRLIGVDRVIDALRSLGLSFGEPAIR
jgi:ADP-heptose:LPS heptosyltransferase/glycosyltransferase involved in cell wall biosynthesis